MIGLLISLFVAVPLAVVLLVPWSKWQHVQNILGVDGELLSPPIYKSYFTDIFLDGVQLNGLVSIFFYEHHFVLRHFSPFFRPLPIRYQDISSIQKARRQFHMFRLKKDEQVIELGFKVVDAARIMDRLKTRLGS
jgi:hypothetical protein